MQIFGGRMFHADDIACAKASDRNKLGEDASGGEPNEQGEE